MVHGAGKPPCRFSLQGNSSNAACPRCGHCLLMDQPSEPPVPTWLWSVLPPGCTSQCPVRMQVPGPNAPLAARLQGISITLVGDSTELNCELARQLARTLGYIPLATCTILQQLTGQR